MRELREADLKITRRRRKRKIGFQRGNERIEREEESRAKKMRESRNQRIEREEERKISESHEEEEKGK